MEGKIDASFATVQRDFFTSGMAAEIGATAFAVWVCIKQHADYGTGKAFPSVRRLADLCGLSTNTVMKNLKILEGANLLRVAGNRKNNGRTYIACERLAVRLGEILVCTVVVDYVPARMREQINKISDALASGKPEALAEVRIIAGDGFKFDPASGVFKASVPVSQLPAPNPQDEHFKSIGEGMLGKIRTKRLASVEKS